MMNCPICNHEMKWDFGSADEGYDESQSAEIIAVGTKYICENEYCELFNVEQ